MALPTYYSTGTASVTNGAITVTGASTAWTSPLRAGDLFGIHIGIAVPIKSVDSDTQLTLAFAWPGATQSAAAYAVQIIPDVARMQENTRILMQQLANGLWLTPGGSGTLAQRSAFDGREQGFIYMRTDVSPFAVYIKKSATSGDWSDATSVVGPKGDTGDQGPAATIAAGTVTIVGTGQPATVTNVGTSGAATFNFDIPQGPGTGDMLSSNNLSEVTNKDTARTNLEVPTNQMLGQNGDLNNLIESGMYYINSGWANVPRAGFAWGQVIVSRGGPGDTIAQMAFDASQDSIDLIPTVFVRSGSPSEVGGVKNWSVWKEILTTFHILDEDDMTSDSDTKVPTQQSVKAYVDGTISPNFGGRLTLSSGTPITEADVAGAGTIYYTPCNGKVILLLSGATFVQRKFDELSLGLDGNSADPLYHQIGKNFDLFVHDNGGTLLLCSGPAWVSDTDRGAGAGTSELVMVAGMLVNKNAMNVRYGSTNPDTISNIPAQSATYVGSFRAVTDGQAEDSKKRRFLFNAYNHASRPMAAFDAASPYTYAVAAWRQANADPNNQIEMLFGLAGTSVFAEAITAVTTTAMSGSGVYGGIGLDTTSAVGADISCAWVAGGLGLSVAIAKYRGLPGLGYHKLVRMEFGNAAGPSFQGADGGNFVARPGIFGEALL